MMGSIESIVRAHAAELAVRDRNANKGTYGKLLIIAGSRGMSGAAYLCGLAALRCGMGMVKYLGPEDNRTILQTLLPEAMYEPDTSRLRDSLAWADYLILGPGLSQDASAHELISRIFDNDTLPLLYSKKLAVIDADALNIIASDSLELSGLSRRTEGGKPVPQNIVITPHAAEMVRLLRRDKADADMDLIKKDPEVAASEYCIRHNCMVVLKDTVTVTASDRAVYRIDHGCSAMAKAGSGDVLCGFIAGTAAMLKGNAYDSVPLAVYLHGRAGCIAAMEKGTHSILARDIAEAAYKAIHEAATRK